MQDQLTVQAETISELFGHINENIMNVYEITKNTLQKSIVKRIPESSNEETGDIERTTLRHIENGINYI